MRRTRTWWPRLVSQYGLRTLTTFSQEIDRYTQSRNEQTHAGVERFCIQQNTANQPGGTNIQSRYKWVAHGAVGPFGVGFGATQSEQPRNGDDVKQQ